MGDGLKRLNSFQFFPSCCTVELDDILNIVTELSILSQLLLTRLTAGPFGERGTFNSFPVAV
ncbi:MAG: hypothetical protein N3E41_08755 [Thermofilaceae archaeon]|nr:hypothetical protein [Thermofilaceae archaeon]